MKVYMTYGHMFSDPMLSTLFEISKKHGVLIAVHAEDDNMIQHLRKKYVAQGCTDAIYHALSRPCQAEVKAIKRVIQLAHKADNAPVYIVHLSTRSGLAAVASAKARGQAVFSETCPQYLFLDETAYRLSGHAGLKYVMSPPLRTKADQTALWQGLKTEDIGVVATDHCPFDFKLKKRLAAHDFSKCPGGAPGIEARIPLIYSYGVSQEGFDFYHLARLTAENPAIIMGLYPQKGVLAKGSDADIILMDLKKNVTITHDLLHENVDYTPYEDIKVNAWPQLTMVRGCVVVKDGELTGKKGFGRFVKRHRFSSEINLKK